MLDAFGVRVAVLPPDEPTRGRWLEQWSRTLTEHDSRTAEAVVDARVTAPDADADRTDYTLASRVTLAALQQREGVRMSLHAAGVTDPHGGALALVAASGTGKTTAARVLGARLGYLSDETVSVGADLSVLAYPKPLSVVIDGDQPRHKSQHGPDELGLLVAPPEATLRGLVLLDRNADHATTGLELLPLDEALELVLPQVSFVTSFDAPLLELTRILQAGGGPWLLRYTEIADHVDDLAALMAAEPGQGESFRHHPGRADAPEGPGGLFARVPWHDAVEVGDSVTVLVAGMSYRLQQLGASVWLALAQPEDLDTLVAASVLRHGEHPDAPRIVQDAVDALVGSGLVVRL